MGSYLCSVCGHRLAMDWLWGGYGEAMGSYVCINLTYRLAMGWLLGGYGEAMGTSETRQRFVRRVMVDSRIRIMF